MTTDEKKLVEDLKQNYNANNINGDNPALPNEFKGNVYASNIQIGKKYLETKIVIISSEDREVRGKDGMPVLEEGFIWWDGNIGSHWHRTLAFITNILKDVFGIDERIETTSYIAHLRATKYRKKDAGTQEGPIKLWKFCVKERYIEKELEILKPDIIWPQGVRAKDTLKNLSTVIKNIAINDDDRIKIQKIKIEKIQKEIICISTPHPAARGKLGSFYHKNEHRHIAEIITAIKSLLEVKK